MKRKWSAIKAWTGLYGFALLFGGTLFLSACGHNEILPQPAPAHQQPTGPNTQAVEEEDDDNTDKPPKDGHGGRKSGDRP